MKKNKKTLIIGLAVVVLLAIIIFGIISYLKVDYAAPISSLKKENSSISRQTLERLNYNFQQKLKEKNVADRKFTYYEKTYYMKDQKYIGCFISDEGFVYQFTFDLNTNEVDLIEYARRHSIIKYQVETSDKKSEDVQ